MLTVVVPQIYKKLLSINWIHIKVEAICLNRNRKSQNNSCTHSKNTLNHTSSFTSGIIRYLQLFRLDIYLHNDNLYYQGRNYA